MRLRELAASRVRFGYSRLTVILRREGWRVNPKRVCQLYMEDGLTVRTKVRKNRRDGHAYRRRGRLARMRNGARISRAPNRLMSAGFAC
jgi:hypothetical protein